MRRRPNVESGGGVVSVVAILILVVAALGAALAVFASNPPNTSTTGPPIDEVAQILPQQEPTTCGSTKIPSAVSHRVWARVIALGGRRVMGTSPCPDGPIQVQLEPGEETLARALAREYGPAISLSVGMNRYDGNPVRSPRCGSLPQVDPLPAGLRLRLRLRERVIRSGSNFLGSVVISEHRDARFYMDTGHPLLAWVLHRGTRHVVGVYAGAVAGTGFTTRLRRGERHAVPVIGGTARCDGGFGSALQPGRYSVVVLVFSEGMSPGPIYVTSPIGVRVIKTK